MPKLVLGMQMCLRLSELNHPFWEEGGRKGERKKKKKKYDTERTLGECEMRAWRPSSRTLPAAELALGPGARRWLDGDGDGDHGAPRHVVCRGDRWESPRAAPVLLWPCVIHWDLLWPCRVPAPHRLQSGTGEEAPLCPDVPVLLACGAQTVVHRAAIAWFCLLGQGRSSSSAAKADGEEGSDQKGWLSCSQSHGTRQLWHPGLGVGASPCPSLHPTQTSGVTWPHSCHRCPVPIFHLRR